MEQKLVLFSRLSLPLVFIALFLGRLGYTVRFLDLSSGLWGIRTLERLARLGIEPLDYQAFDAFDQYRALRIKDCCAREILSTALPREALAFFSGLFPGLADIESKLFIYLYSLVAAALGPLANLLNVAEHLAEQGERVSLFLPASPLEYLGLRAHGAEPRNLCPGLVWYLAQAWLLTWRVARKAVSLAKRLVISSGHPSCGSTQGPTLDPVSAEVLFFPHKGVGYGRLFAKDHFYAEDPTSPLNPFRILHVELADKMSPSERESLTEDYARHGLPALFLSSKTQGLWGILLGFAIFVMARPWRMLSALPGNPLPGLFLVLGGYLLFRRDLAALSSLTAARLALAGYDYLFPKSMALALQSRGIRVVSTQERFIQAFYPHTSYIFDLYLVIGTLVRERLSKSDLCSIGRMAVTGAVRCDLLHDLIAHRAAPRPAAEKPMVLVLDYHSSPDEVVDRFLPTINYRNNIAFYQDILAMARTFQDVRFVIRGKDDVWCSIPAFDEVFKEIEAQPNLEVNRDYSELNISYRLAASSALVIARHTSLGDECLAAGIPVLFHDFLPNGQGIVSAVFDYKNYPIFVYSRTELENRLRDYFKTGQIMDLAGMNRMRAHFYGPGCDGEARNRIHEELKQVMVSRV